MPVGKKLLRKKRSSDARLAIRTSTAQWSKHRHAALDVIDGAKGPSRKDAVGISLKAQFSLDWIVVYVSWTESLHRSVLCAVDRSASSVQRAATDHTTHTFAIFAPFHPIDIFAAAGWT